MAQTAFAAKRRITLAGAAIDAVLALIKAVGGVIGHSQALIADAAHSASDLASDVLVLWAARIGAQPPDANHPYGHERFETAATLGLGATLLMVAGGFAYDAGMRLLQPERIADPGWLALSIACLSVIGKEAAYRFTMRVANRYDSDLLRANAWHSRNDALSSLVVIIGVLGALAGYPFMDAVAALAVSLLIGVTGWKLGWRAGAELVDTSLEPDQIEDIRRRIASVQGVEGQSDLRTRRMGNRWIIDVTIRVEPWITASETDRILSAVRERLHQDLDRRSDVRVAMEVATEPPHPQPPTALPLRSSIEPQLRQLWQPLMPSGSDFRLVLHYRADRIDVDVRMPWPGEAAQAARLHNHLAAAAQPLAAIGTVRLLCESDAPSRPRA
ncbi:cation diffusion facilitator family transporter [Algiphilus sp.]|uniref:cation diffusion facilitator family transporter n=1 Tax=Algiphilus sp. TaxID=1872431 RepID=UPI0032EBF90E